MGHLKLLQKEEETNFGTTTGQEVQEKSAGPTAAETPVETSEETKDQEQQERNRMLALEIEQCSKFFIERKKIEPETDYSKHFLIFSYNYYSIGMDQAARQMLNHVTDSYIKNDLLKDMEQAVWHRNKADELIRRRKKIEAQKHQAEAEFFLVVLYIMPYLKKEPSMKDKECFKEFLTALTNRSFEIQLAPSMELIDENN